MKASIARLNVGSTAALIVFPLPPAGRPSVSPPQDVSGAARRPASDTTRPAEPPRRTSSQRPSRRPAGPDASSRGARSRPDLPEANIGMATPKTPSLGELLPTQASPDAVLKAIAGEKARPAPHA